MNVPSKDIEEMLEAEILVDSATTALFPISRVLLDPALSNCVSILDYSGRKPQLTMDKAKYEFPTVQISIKCVDYDTGWEFMSAIIDVLHGKAHEVWNDTYYSLIECLNGPTFMKRENQRSIFVANFMIQRREN